jgi:hypothetical protein
MMKNELINKYQIQSLNDDGIWESIVEFPYETHKTQKAMDVMIERLNMYRKAHNEYIKFRLVLIGQITITEV